jgi:hypothetical protein
LIMSTSTVDTIDLPEGASLKNGMDDVAPPPLPPINPRRRATKGLFGLGNRKEVEETTPPAFGSRSKTPDPWVGTRPVENDFPFEPPNLGNRTASETRSPRMPKQSFDQHPAHRPNAYIPTNGSPERFERSPVPRQPNGMEGGMF